MASADLLADPRAALLNSLTVAEYQALRDEILQLEALQARLTTFTAIAFGAVVSVGLQLENPLIVLVYPMLALLLGVSWMSNAHGIQRCANYIRRLERRLQAPYFGWETFVLDERLPATWIAFWGGRAIFAVSAALAMMASLLIEVPRGGVVVMFSVSGAVAVVVVLLTVLWRERLDRPATSPLVLASDGAPQPTDTGRMLPGVPPPRHASR